MTPSAVLSASAPATAGGSGIFEVLTLDEELREMIARGAPVREIRAAARARGVETRARTACARSSTGSTSYLELVRVTS